MNTMTRTRRAPSALSAVRSVTDAHGRDGDPEWYRDAVIYQLHVKSFFDSNDDGVGDFPGLLQKLDYIVELGVNVVWLLPFYPSPLRDDGYDISEYRDIHPDYGTLRDARRFMREAHKRGLRVITELVINHTSDQHPWFQRARLAKPGSWARDFYVWSDTDQRYPETRIIFLDTEKSNWTWDPVAQAYFWHRFYSHQPDLNFDNPRVLEAVCGVMKFWLDSGVDGLRLDAVPYLIEREGTINENLPETHAILRFLRARMDEGHPARMLLAEANQWPEDTQQYFGNGDECHMAFHFPLMPRMYMAIAQEDRFPISDILRQTPDIPAGCQWAIFLRNHDELTLEMVTDQERDYLWSTYAADRRARLNLGIRRRLAPLMENDRRRIELMNGLLLSMPGTPVIYYGDEIGMGDNIFLRDRDGVRTPMQWTSDRNGGFSRADPAGLVLPALQDPLYGFQAVNVEAQMRDPHSMLHWMRRILSVRSRGSVFGRASMRLLYPGNRKILAYLREHESSAVLCVFNLSRSAQAVELDLSGYAGRVPVEMLGDSAFPPIGQLPYLLTLPPYGFYWFMLSTEDAMPSWHTPSPLPMPELRTRVFNAPLADMLNGPLRADLEQNELKDYLARRRWFSAKNKALSSVHLDVVAPLPGTGGRVVMAEVVAELDGGTERFSLPLATVEETDAVTPLPSQLALGRFRRGRHVGYITDAFAADPFAHAVIAALRADGSAPTGSPTGDLRFVPTSLMERTPPPGPEIRRFSAEQSNSSLAIGDSMVVKIIRRLAPGIHPEVEMTRYLTEAGVEGIASLLGHAERSIDGDVVTMLIVQSFVRNQGDGWTWTLDWLRRRHVGGRIRACRRRRSVRRLPRLRRRGRTTPRGNPCRFGKAKRRPCLRAGARDRSRPCRLGGFDRGATGSGTRCDRATRPLGERGDRSARPFAGGTAQAVAPGGTADAFGARRGSENPCAWRFSSRPGAGRAGRRRDRRFRRRAGAKSRRTACQDDTAERRRGSAAQLRLRRGDAAAGKPDGRYAISGTAAGRTRHLAAGNHRGVPRRLSRGRTGLAAHLVERRGGAGRHGHLSG